MLVFRFGPALDFLLITESRTLRTTYIQGNVLDVMTTCVWYRCTDIINISNNFIQLPNPTETNATETSKY